MRRKLIYSIVEAIGTGVLSALLLALASNANAQCGGSLNSLAGSAFSIQSKSRSSLITSFAAKAEPLPFLRSDGGDGQDWSIVGLWHVDFNIMPPGAPGPITIQEAFQIWNSGGTEVHNPNVDPRTSAVCLGAWREDRGTYRLTHRVWSYSPDGVWLGTINLSETVKVVNHGQNQAGTFTLDFFDPAGNPLEIPGVHPAHVEGAVVGVRIPAN